MTTKTGVVSDVVTVGAANTAIEGTVRGDFNLYLGIVTGSSSVGGLFAIVKPVHGRGSLDEADVLVGFFESPEIEVDGGASGAVGKGTVVDVEGKGIGEDHRSSGVSGRG